MLNNFTFTKPYTRLAANRSGYHKRNLFAIDIVSWQKFACHRRELALFFQSMPSTKSESRCKAIRLSLFLSPG